MDLNYTPLPPMPQHRLNLKSVSLVMGGFLLLVSLVVGLTLVNTKNKTASQAQVATATCPAGTTEMNDAAQCNSAGGTVDSFINVGSGDMMRVVVCCRILTPTPPTSCPEGTELIDIALCPNPVVVGQGDGMPADKVCCPIVTPTTPPGDTPIPTGTPSACVLVQEPEIINVIVKCPLCTPTTQ